MKKTLTMIAILTLCVLMTVCLAACGGSGSEKKEEGGENYVVLMNPDFPPFDTTDAESGDLAGFDVDMVNAIAEDQGFTVEWKSMEFDSLIPALEAGNGDIVASGMNGDVPERQEKVDFTDPYYKSGLVVLVKADNDTINSEEDLTKDMRVASQSGTTGADEVNRLKDEGLIKEAVILKGFDECVLQLQNGDSEAVIIDEPVAKGYMKMKEGEFKAVGETINAERYAMAVAKGNDELKEKLNTGLKNIVESGKFAEICEKWEVANMYEE
ncbi:MAG: basic amino acid ABC transporter substrate-binding protein [Eubacterium sp.]|nr:basic amino acid ABC transporter substrate-binding protein [Eubacterium sp.]